MPIFYGVHWKQRLFASASAIALGCALSCPASASPLDVVAQPKNAYKLDHIPRTSAPPQWTVYKPLSAEAQAKITQDTGSSATALASQKVSKRLSPLEVVAGVATAPVATASARTPPIGKQNAASEAVQANVESTPAQSVSPATDSISAARNINSLAANVSTPAKVAMATRDAAPRKRPSPLDVVATDSGAVPATQSSPAQKAAVSHVDVGTTTLAAHKQEAPKPDAASTTVVQQQTTSAPSSDADYPQVKKSPLEVVALLPRPAMAQKAIAMPVRAGDGEEVYTPAPVALAVLATPVEDSKPAESMAYAEPLWKAVDDSTTAQPEVQEAEAAEEMQLAAMQPAAGKPLQLLPPASAKKEHVDAAFSEAEAVTSAPQEESQPPEVPVEQSNVEKHLSPTADNVSAPKNKMPQAELSEESKAVLEGLPPEVREGDKIKRNVRLERSNKADTKDEVKKHEAYGMKISVKRPKMDVFRMLESAYNSLIAGDQQYAITLYKEVLEEEPENTLALFGLATTYHRAGQTQLARPIYAKLLEIDPHNIEGLNNFLVLLADEAPEEALLELEKLRHTHPGFSPVLAQMALIYEKQGEYEKASEKLAQAYAISPENMKYQYNMAIVLDKMKKWDEAAQWYQRLVTASDRGEKIPGNAREIQQRLTFIRSNTSSVN